MDIQRDRKIDLNSLKPEEADQISKMIGDKVRQICDEAVEKANTILKIYGMNCKMAIVIDGLEQKEEKTEVLPKKRGRKPKKSNLKKE